MWRWDGSYTGCGALEVELEVELEEGEELDELVVSSQVQEEEPEAGAWTLVSP